MQLNKELFYLLHLEFPNSILYFPYQNNSSKILFIIETIPKIVNIAAKVKKRDLISEKSNFIVKIKKQAITDITMEQ